jgi:hypothetical protein
VKLLQNRSLRILLGSGVCIAIITVGAMAASGAFSNSPSNSSDGLVRYSKRPVARPQAQSNVTPAGILAGILARVNNPSVSRATLAGPPSWAHESEDPTVPNSPGFANSRWLYITVKAPVETEEATTRPLWLGNLITGALRDELYSAAQAPLRSSVVSLTLGDGHQVALAGGGIGAVTPGQVFSSGSDQQIRQRITTAAQTAGLTVDSIDIVRAHQPAPAVVVTTSDPRAAAANPDAVLTSLFGEPGTYEGEYLEVRATDGTLVFVQGSAFRTGVGQRWVNPTFASSGETTPTPTP